MDHRFFEMGHRIDCFMFWPLGKTVTVGGIVIAVFKHSSLPVFVGRTDFRDWSIHPNFPAIQPDPTSADLLQQPH